MKSTNSIAYWWIFLEATIEESSRLGMILLREATLFGRFTINWFLKLWKISWVENTESSVLGDLGVQWFFFIVDRSTPPQAIFPTWNRASVYLRLSAVINHIRRFKHQKYIAHRDFTPIERLHDDCRSKIIQMFYLGEMACPNKPWKPLWREL